MVCWRTRSLTGETLRNLKDSDGGLNCQDEGSELITIVLWQGGLGYKGGKRVAVVEDDKW